MIYNQQIENAYNQISKRGITNKQGLDQHEMVKAIMHEGFRRDGKIWWFAYELMGHWEIKGEKFFMSYKASTRVCELAKDGEVETRPTQGKLCVYALKKIINHVNSQS